MLANMWVFCYIKFMRRNKVVSNKITHMKPIDGGILIAVFFMFVLLIVGVSIGTTRYKERQILLVQDSMEILADNQRVQFEQYVDNKVSILQGLAMFPEIYEMSTEKQKQFIKTRSQALGFHHLFIMKNDGMVYYVEEDLCRNQKNEPFFYDVMSHDVYITEPFYGADATTMTITVSIFDDNRKKVGALCGAVTLEEIQRMFMENRMFLGGKSMLINRDGNYISADDMVKVYVKTSIYDQRNTDASLIQKAFDEKGDQKGIIVMDGIEYQANVTYLESFNWVIVQCIEIKTIFEGLEYIDIWRYSSIVIVAIIILCVIRIVVYWHRSDKKINTDTLTGCNSRAAMQNLLEYLNLTKKHDIAVVYLDLNKFKYVNDTYGHEIGDKILCIFSQTLMEVFGDKGYVGRIGGDEFMVILQDLAEAQILELCQKVQELLTEKSKSLDFDYTISTSYGCAMRKMGSNQDLNEIVTKADERMYCYKENHR